MVEVAIRRWVHCGSEGMHIVSVNRPWHSSDDGLVLTGPKCAKKTFPTPLHHRHQPGLLSAQTSLANLC